MRGLILSLVLFVTWANTPIAGEINKSFLRGIAIEGYDPVAYIVSGGPAQGITNYSYEWKDATWYFTSESNRNLFRNNPEKYAPQFGGHCANGLSEGHKVSGNPEIWRMIDGKLYFFYSERGRQRWSSNTDLWIKDAWRNWEKLKFE